MNTRHHGRMALRPWPPLRRTPTIAAIALGGACLLTPAAGAARTVVPPPAGAQFEYQLGGAYPPAPATRIVVRDRTERPARGRYNVCYVNAFQTQPQQNRWWRAHHPTLLLRRRGRAVQDPDWPGEVLLDTRTTTRRRAIARIVGRWLRGCAEDGFRAVDLDNLDSWTRSRGLLRRSANAALARSLVARAHRLGLAVAQKNTVELLPQARRLRFDFAIAEDCQRYAECDAFTAVYGRRVYEIEYAMSAFRAACAARGAAIAITYRDRDLRPAGRPGHRSAHC